MQLKYGYPKVYVTDRGQNICKIKRLFHGESFPSAINIGCHPGFSMLANFFFVAWFEG